MLTVLLVLELSAMFIAAPLAAKGLPMARAVVETLVLAVLLIVVLLSQKWAAIILILLGLAATVASFPLSGIGLRFRRQCFAAPERFSPSRR